MPLVFIASGIVLVLTGVKGNPADLYALVKGEFEGPNNFVYWLVAIVVLGGLGYVQQLEKLSRLFVALVVIVLLLDNKGFFAQLQKFLDSSSTPATGAQSQ